MSGLLETNIKSLPFLHRGKVRDIYAVGDDKLLVIQTDRLSAFDVILDDPIPNKGRVLTTMSNFWFKKFGHLMPNHETGIDPESVVTPEERAQVEGRAIVVRKFKPLAIEAIVRGYIIGSGWKDYQKTGAICGIALPAGLQEAQKLPQTIFTPSTKAPMGAHDENISFEEADRIVGADIARQVRDAQARDASLVDEHVIVGAATERARVLIAEAEQSAAAERTAADDYAREVVQRLEEQLERWLGTVREGLQSLPQPPRARGRRRKS